MSVGGRAEGDRGMAAALPIRNTNIHLYIVYIVYTHRIHTMYKSTMCTFRNVNMHHQKYQHTPTAQCTPTIVNT